MSRMSVAARRRTTKATARPSTAPSPTVPNPFTPGFSSGAMARGMMTQSAIRQWVSSVRNNQTLAARPLAEQIVLWQQLADSLTGLVEGLENYSMAVALQISSHALPRTRGVGRWMPAEVRVALAAERILVECEHGLRPMRTPPATRGATATAWSDADVEAGARAVEFQWYAAAWRALDGRLLLSRDAGAQMKRLALRILETASGERATPAELRTLLEPSGKAG